MLSLSIHSKERKERKSLKDSSRQLSLLSDAAEADGSAPPESTTPQPSPRDLVDLWNQEIAGSGLSMVRELSQGRRKKCELRLKERRLEEWRKVFRHCASTPFLSGQRGSWRASFDWAIANDGNAVKVLEGRYSDKAQPAVATCDRQALRESIMRGL